LLSAKPTLGVVDGILHSDSQIAAEQVRLRQHRKGVSADAEPVHATSAGKMLQAKVMVWLVAGKPYLTPRTRHAIDGLVMTSRASRSCMRWMSPVSNNSSSGMTPAS